MKKTTLNLLKSGAAPLALILAGAAGSMMIAAPAAAQDYTNVNASGRVSGADGTPVAGATVTITSEDQGFSRTVTTNSSGSYTIPQLPTGRYTFSVSADGLEAYSETGVVLSQAQTANNFTLVGGTSGEAGIVVTGSRVQVADFERTTTGSVIEIGELATRVPVARDLTSVINLAPQTTFGDTAFGNLPNIGGSSVAENAYYINGLNITEFREGLGSVTVPFELYQTIEVKSGGFPAEFGRTTGGVVNAITKSGSNEFHAGVLVNWQPDFLRSNNKDTVFSENSREEADRINTTFYASGPIIKDRLFVYGLYETRNVTSTNTLTGYSRIGLTDSFRQSGVRLDQDSTSSPFYAVKVDAIPLDGQRLEFTYFNSTGEALQRNFDYVAYNDTVTTATPGIGAQTGSNITGYGGENYVGRYTGNFGKFLTLSAAYGKNKFRDTAGSSDDSYPFIFDNRTLSSLGNAIQLISRSLDEREFYRADADVFVDFLGSHHFKGGYDRENLTTNTTNSYTGGAAYGYFNSGTDGDNNVSTPNTNYVAARTFINGGVFKSTNEAFYIQDSWSLLNDRVTLQIGARNDKFENENAEGQVYYNSGSNWAPRLGFSADVFGDGRTKLYGSFGRYYLPVAANTNIRLAGSELDYTRYNVLTGLNPDNTPIIGAPILTVPGAAPCQDTGIVNCIFTADGVPTPTDSTVAKNLKAQSVDEFIIGAEHRLGSLWTVGLYYTHRKLVRALEDAAIDAAVNQYCVDEGIATYEECSSTYSGFHQYVLINPGSDSTITLSDPLPGETTVRTINFTAAQLGYPKATRAYDAVTFKFDRAFDGKWSLGGSYTWSRLFGNYEGAVKSDNGQTDAGLTTDFDQPGLTHGTNGFSPNHRTHNFKAYGSYQLTKWLTIGANGTVVSPRKFGCIGRIPASVDFFAQFYGAAGFYCNVDANGKIITDERTGVRTNTSGALTPRGSVFQSDWRTQLDLSFVLRLPTEAFNADFRFDVFNVFNSGAALDFEERGTLNNGRPRNTYQQVSNYQAARSGRVTFALRF